MVKGVKEKRRKRKNRLFGPLRGGCSVERPDYSSTKVKIGIAEQHARCKWNAFYSVGEQSAKPKAFCSRDHHSILKPPIVLLASADIRTSSPQVQAYHIRLRVADAGFCLDGGVASVIAPSPKSQSVDCMNRTMWTRCR